MSGCGKEDAPDTEAPVITLITKALSVETGDNIIPSSLVRSIKDNSDPAPVIVVTIGQQTIAYNEAYTFAVPGDLSMTIRSEDNS